MSTKPGVTSRPLASISSAPAPATLPTAAILPSFTATSASRIPVPVPSATVPPRTTRSNAAILDPPRLPQCNAICSTRRDLCSPCEPHESAGAWPVERTGDAFMSGIERRGLAGLLAAGALFPGLARAETPTLALMTAGQGSAFLPYGQGIAHVVNAAGVARIDVKESKGSNENLDAVDASATTLGTAFLGSAYDAINGEGFAAGRKHANVRALFPMYETAFMVATLKSRSLTNLQSLDGKKVGCGPAAGPAEGYFRAAAEIAGIKPLVVGGTPANQGRELIAGKIDAFWQGAVVPIPSLVAVADV